MPRKKKEKLREVDLMDVKFKELHHLNALSINIAAALKHFGILISIKQYYRDTKVQRHLAVANSQFMEAWKLMKENKKPEIKDYQLDQANRIVSLMEYVMYMDDEAIEKISKQCKDMLDSKKRT